MKNGTITALTLEELRSLLLVTLGRDYSFYVLVLIAVHHGLRISEAISLKRSDFTEGADGIYLTVKRLKGSETTTQRVIWNRSPLLNEQAVVQEYIARLGAKDCLFCDSGKPLTRFQALTLIKRYGREAGLAPHKRTFRSLKHTAGTLLRLSGAPIELIAGHLGHVNVQNSRVYMDVTPQEVHAAASLAFLGVSRRLRAGAPKAFAATAGGD